MNRQIQIARLWCWFESRPQSEELALMVPGEVSSLVLEAKQLDELRGPDGGDPWGPVVQSWISVARKIDAYRMGAA